MYKSRLLKDIVARKTMLILAIFCFLILFSIGLGLFIKSLPILQEKSLWQLLTTSSWKPSKGEFGFASYILSTLLVTLIAIVIALPLGLMSAIYVSEYAPKGLRRFFNPIIDLLSGIPPVIYGVWGTLTVVPFIADVLSPIFDVYSSGYSALAAGIVLSVMIIPLILGLLLEVFDAVPKEMREASLSMGATKWQTIKKVILRKSFAGILATVVLAISRAFGETIAVLMVAGNFTDIPKSVFDACYPLPALIANNFGEMMSIPEYESALMLAALILFVIIVLFNAASRWVLSEIDRRYK